MTMAVGHAYGASGNRAEAQKAIDELKVLAQKRYVPALYIAPIYGRVGEQDEAMRWLEKAYEERSHYLLFLKREPWADPVRSDPRFQALVRRIGCQNPDLLNPTSVLSHRIDLLVVRGAIGVEQARLVRADPEERIGGLGPSDHAGGVAKLTIADGGLIPPRERRCPHRRTCARWLRDASLRSVPGGAGLGSP